MNLFAQQPNAKSLYAPGFLKAAQKKQAERAIQEERERVAASIKARREAELARKVQEKEAAKKAAVEAKRAATIAAKIARIDALRAVQNAFAIDRKFLKDILAEVSAQTGVSRDQIMSAKRLRSVTVARQFLYWRAYHETPLSLSQIGQKFDRDHTTVLHGIRKTEDRIAAGDPQVLAWIKEAGL